MRLDVGVDTGGTFTDFVAVDAASGRLVAFKVPSVPADPASAVLDGLRRLDAPGAPASLGRFIFGTTVATNAVLERKGARVALIATRGTRDVLEIQRLWRSRLFDLYLRKPPPLVPRRRRFEVDERVGADGAVVRPLTDAAAREAAAAVADCEAVAVCLLFSFLDESHERRLRDAIRAVAPDRAVSLSCEISPRFREYERTCTTVMNAYVTPAVRRLVRRLESGLEDAGRGGEARVLQSNGGLMRLAKAAERPVNTLLSGPAGGVVGAAAVAGLGGVRDLVTMDMGGTSLDVCLVRGGVAPLSGDGEVGGYAVQIPQVDVHTIGAGGGSIARVRRGVLSVGPESAGADPGPACYGRGGRDATSTDAAVVLGYVDPGYFAGGEMRLDAAAAREAIAREVGEPLGLAPEEAAMAVVRVQVSNMVGGVRAVSVERGLDPREFALVPFGGAGGLYAGLLAADLGLRRMLVPVYPGVLSALGMLLTDVRYTEVTTRLLPAEPGREADVEAVFAGLEDRLAEAMGAEVGAAGEVRFERTCEMRFRGQAYEVEVASRRGEPVASLAARFRERHLEMYGQEAAGEPVEIVSYRATGVGRVERAAIPPLEPGGDAAAARKGTRRAWFHGLGEATCPVYDRGALPPSARLEGPAIFEEAGATFVLCPGQRLEVDRVGNLHVAVPEVTR